MQPRNMGVERPDLSLTEVLVEHASVDLPRAFGPQFDALWRSGGWLGSPNFDDQGNWKLADELG